MVAADTIAALPRKLQAAPVPGHRRHFSTIVDRHAVQQASSIDEADVASPMDDMFFAPGAGIPADRLTGAPKGLEACVRDPLPYDPRSGAGRDALDALQRSLGRIDPRRHTRGDPPRWH